MLDARAVASRFGRGFPSPTAFTCNLSNRSTTGRIWFRSANASASFLSVGHRAVESRSCGGAVWRSNVVLSRSHPSFQSSAAGEMLAYAAKRVGHILVFTRNATMASHAGAQARNIYSEESQNMVDARTPRTVAVPSRVNISAFLLYQQCPFIRATASCQQLAWVISRRRYRSHNI